MQSAVAANQVTTVRGQLKDQNGLTIPLGLALWAHVSDEVDKKLEAQQQANIPFRLAPHEWKSGEIPWLLAVLAPQDVARALVKKLEASVFKDKPYKKFALTQETKKPMAVILLMSNRRFLEVLRMNARDRY